MDRSQLNKARQRLLAMVDSHPSYDLAGLSRLLGKNHAYLHQYIWKGSPRELREKDMRIILQALSGSETTQNQPGSIRIPQFSFRAGMGGGGIINDENTNEYLALPRKYLEQMQLSSADLITIEVDGDSMSPTLESGDRIMINQNDKNSASGGIFAIHDSDALVVKRVERIPASEPPLLKLISDNPNHGTYEVPAVETNILGRVVWYARKL
ncbi:MAG: S24 family peptidase [Hellea sp.]|nr:S24 family peptidase [Hellea sp.]